MNSQSEIITLKNKSNYKYKEKGSVFIGYAVFVNSVEEAEKVISKAKQKYYDASHNCYAYHLSNNIDKYSDDGEPNGTAGIRVLNAIQHFKLSNTLCIVTRYFGGTKLGVGPLGKAYYSSAFEVLNKAEKINLCLFVKINIFYDYEFSRLVHYEINRLKVRNITEKYNEKPIIECYIPPQNLAALENKLINVSSGNIIIMKVNEYMYLNC